jgi:hypothetical protein
VSRHVVFLIGLARVNLIAVAEMKSMAEMNYGNQQAAPFRARWFDDLKDVSGLSQAVGCIAEV